MKKHSRLPIILAGAAILFLLGLAGFLTYLYYFVPAVYTGSVVDLLRQDAEQLLNPRQASGSEGEDYIDGQPVPAHNYIFVGDSRTVGMQDALLQSDPSDPCTFIAQSGEGYWWLYNTGIHTLEEKLQEDPDAVVIFNLGVNDLKDIDQYILYYQELFSRYPEPSFYIMSVNPVLDEKCSGASNAEILTFNAKIKEAFPEQYLDSFHYLDTYGFESADGLHYSNDTYRSIHAFVVETLSK